MCRLPKVPFTKYPKLRPATLLKKRFWHRCFSLNFAKFLRTPFLTEHLWWQIFSLFSLRKVMYCNYPFVEDNSDHNAKPPTAPNFLSSTYHYYFYTIPTPSQHLETCHITGTTFIADLVFSLAIHLPFTLMCQN